MASKKHVAKKTAPAKVVSNVKSGSDSDHGPIVVKVMSILGFIGAGFAIFIGLMMIVFGNFITSIIASKADVSKIPAGMLGSLIMGVAIAIIVVSILMVFVCRGLWKHQEWARITAIVLAAIGFAGGIFTLPSGILRIILDGLVIYFLAFDDAVIRLFKK